MNTENKGSLEVICGSMFSGKSEELIRRVKRSQLAKKQVIVFKHSLDQRQEIEYVTSHNGNKINAVPIDDPARILELISDDIEVVGIDEIQFFSQDIVNVVCTLIEKGKRVITAGLDLDFKQIPFGPMPLLLAIADHITKLKAICIKCGKEAHFTQRLVNNEPATSTDQTIMIGAEEKYQARCRNCHIIDQQPSF
jgi:thymidine kinase